MNTFESTDVAFWEASLADTPEEVHKRQVEAIAEDRRIKRAIRPALVAPDIDTYLALEAMHDEEDFIARIGEIAMHEERGITLEIICCGVMLSYARRAVEEMRAA